MSDVHAEPPRKVCPSCGGEFQPWVERCVDCEVPLVTPEEAASHAAQLDVDEIGGEPGWEGDLEAGQELVLLRSEKVAWIRRLAAELEAEGIPFHIEPGQHGGDLAIYVTPEDLDDARRFDAAIYRQEVHGAGGAPREDQEPSRPPRRPAATEAGPSVKVCPRCGGEYQSWVERCADCEVPLVLAGAGAGAAAASAWDDPEEDEEEPAAFEDEGPEEREGYCPACGTALPPQPRDCPECGLALGAPPGLDLDER